jgi:hypothetical protein
MLLSRKRLDVLISLFKSFVVIIIYKILSSISNIHKEYNYIQLIENEINQTTGSIMLSNTSQTRNSIMYDTAFEMGHTRKIARGSSRSGIRTQIDGFVEVRVLLVCEWSSWKDVTGTFVPRWKMIEPSTGMMNSKISSDLADY